MSGVGARSQSFSSASKDIERLGSKTALRVICLSLIFRGLPLDAIKGAYDVRVFRFDFFVLI